MSKRTNLIILLLIIGGCTACSLPATKFEKTPIVQNINNDSTESEQSESIEGDDNLIESDEDKIQVIEVQAEHSSATSANGKYRIESYGVIEESAAGGLYPSEGIRLIEVETQQEKWSISPGYFVQDYLWSADDRFVAVYIETRISGETFILDTETMSTITLPNIEQIRNQLNTDTTVSETRPDPYMKFEKWLDHNQLLVNFMWSGAAADGYEGNYTYDITANTLIEAQLTH